jgi:hypothetical protein
VEQPVAPDFSMLAHRPVPSSGVQSAAQFRAHLGLIMHEWVLQPIGTAMIRIDLSRQCCESGDGAGAVPDLDIAADQLRLAAAALRRLMDGLIEPRSL